MLPAIRNNSLIPDEMIEKTFCSLSSLKRDKLPKFPLGDEIVNFHAFDKVPLGIPSEYIQTKKDGACFYEFLSLALTCSDGARFEIRQHLCDYLQANYDLFYEKTGFDKEEHAKLIEKQRRPRTYADYIFVLASALLFNVNIYVFQDELNEWLFFP